ncbi:MAG: hypothetical protein JW937_03845 [Candidatus Omnitrophica bacterium]|nr:hypothetical protein [Candidatus Omnitrophota bacterium]
MNEEFVQRPSSVRSKNSSLIAGALALIVGVLLLIGWGNSVIVVIQGTLPGLLILLGLAAVFAGLSEMRQSKK